MRFQRYSTVSQQTNAPEKSPAHAPISNRDRVLEAACELFAEAGFHGTHLREICKRAGTNVAGVCYHFQSKEGLYQAAKREAGRQLCAPGEGFMAVSHLSPQQRFLTHTESLLQRLGTGRAWIARLLARELVDPATKTDSYAASQLERDFILLQSVMRDLLGTDAYSDGVRLHAITLIGECVFYSLTRENPQHPLNQLFPATSTRTLARFLTQRSLRALRHESADPDSADFNL